MKKTSNPTIQSSGRQDEQDFKDYLQGNSPLSDIYQQTTVPEPSAALDKSILSAAKNHATAKKVSHWWQRPGSWAASAVVFSLVGLLTLNTWQDDQTQTDTRLSSPAPVPAKVEADVQFQTLAPAKKGMLKKSKNDTRKLIYKRTPAPVMQAMENRPMAAEMEILADRDMPGPYHYLQQIKYLITQNKLDEARQQLLELQTKYPNHPVDPVILQQLSP